jgi:hypothetical protein
MRNQEVLIRKGVSTVGGILIRDIVTNSTRGFALSENGRFWVGLVQLAGGGDDAMILYDLGLVVPIPGCEANPSTLTKLSGDARLGALLVLSMDGAQGPGTLPSMHFSRQPAILNSPCGIMTSYGELLINFNPGMRLAKIEGAPVTSGPSSIGVNIPVNTALVGMEFFAQGVFFDPGSTNGGPVFSLTNAMQLIIGAS